MSSLPTNGLTPIAPTRCLGKLPVALGFTLRRRVGRPDRVLQQLLGGLRGPNNLRQQLPISSAQVTTLQSLLKALAILGTQIDRLEAFQQETSDHGGSPTQCVFVIDSASQRCLV
jgi:hypothetical protein